MARIQRYISPSANNVASILDMKLEVCIDYFTIYIIN